MAKERVDKLVHQAGLTTSREQAQRLIMAGQIYDQNNQRYDKPGERIPSSYQLHIKGQEMPYVSRGGLKLEKAIDYFNINMTDQILLDIGASTGGFTDCALQHGALQSYALDVGYNQLAYQLRQDERVIVMERHNFRHATPDLFEKGTPTIASIDVSFISLRLILPPLIDILKKNGSALVLIKPQFEAGRARIGKKGVIRDPEIQIEVITEVLAMIAGIGFQIKGLTFSPITGGEGNIEFLAHLKNTQTPGNLSNQNIQVVDIVQQAHQKLKIRH